MTPYIFVYTTFPKEEDAMLVAKSMIVKKAGHLHQYLSGRAVILQLGRDGAGHTGMRHDCQNT
jgi:hypothetical protein